ncbi:MAG: hypothetical protein EXS03_02275 [Phycisphaerales bacterium]|nr:hypothetical protein [Phycisphaerales bacterium]
MAFARTLVAILVAAAITHSVLCGEPTAAPSIEPGHLYDRIAVVGASASDGFGVVIRWDISEANPHPVAIHLNLTTVLRHAARAGLPANEGAPRPIIHHYASGLFFASPGTVGRSEVDRALKSKPTLVIALDYLFWWVYGTVDGSGQPMADEAARLANLELGLSQLDRVLAEGTPIIIGDLPNMKDAIGKMLSAAQVPSPETLVKANERIGAWVSTRPGVRMVPLAAILASLKRGETVTLGGSQWDPAKCGAMLQGDQLHPTFCGTVALAAGIMMTASEFDPSSASPWTMDPVAIRQCALLGERTKARPVGR